MNTWTDSKTGLEWQVDPPVDRMNYSKAEKYASDLGDGWRLPTRKELIGITGGNRPKELKGKDWFWSSLPVGGGAVYRWLVLFLTGHVSVGHVSSVFYVRCVR